MWTQINDWMWETEAPFPGAIAGKDFCRVWQPLGSNKWYSSGDTYYYDTLEDAKAAAEKTVLIRSC